MGTLRVQEVVVPDLISRGLLASRSARLDRRARHILYMMIGVAFLNFLDLFCTLTANRMGMLDENNPLAAIFIKLGLTPSLICFKILMVSCGLGMLWRARASRLVVPACWLLLGTYTVLTILWYCWACAVREDLGMRIAN